MPIIDNYYLILLLSQYITHRGILTFSIMYITISPSETKNMPNRKIEQSKLGISLKFNIILIVINNIIIFITLKMVYFYYFSQE